MITELVEVGKFPEVKILTMDKGTIMDAIEVENSSDVLPIVDRPSIDKETFTEAITVEGPDSTHCH
jgi:hypothetical protein